MPEAAAPNIRNRSYTIAAEVNVETTDASGVLFSQGSRFGGHALYVKDSKLKYVYNFVGELLQVIESDQPIPTGHVVLSATFETEGGSMPTEGTLTLHIRDHEVGMSTIRTQPGKFGLGGGGLVVGASGAEPVTDDYSGERPWPFVGGTIKRVRHRRQRRNIRRSRHRGPRRIRPPMTTGSSRPYPAVRIPPGRHAEGVVSPYQECRSALTA